jgi:arginyl-tRNA synthetase
MHDYVWLSLAGDTLSRLLEYCGADVERVSHVGDLGLPVALVMAAMEAVDTSPQLASQVLSTPYRTGDSPSPSQLSELYVFAKATVGDGVASRQSLADNADALAAHATQEESQTLSSRFRARLSALLLDIQKGSHAQCATRVLWTRLVSASQRGYNALFHRLDVKVVERGESTYVDDLPSVVAALKANGSAVFSDGAWVVPLGGAPKVPPVVIQKRDGGFLYATIDVAAIKCRLDAGFSHLIYVTDSSQSLHFTSLFRVSSVCSELNTRSFVGCLEKCVRSWQRNKVGRGHRQSSFPTRTLDSCWVPTEESSAPVKVSNFLLKDCWMLVLRCGVCLLLRLVSLFRYVQ